MHMHAMPTNYSTVLDSISCLYMRHLHFACLLGTLAVLNGSQYNEEQVFSIQEGVFNFMVPKVFAKYKKHRKNRYFLIWLYYIAHLH